jgi:hypothetical protein
MDSNTTAPSAQDTKFRPGVSGNPNGRPKGSGFAGQARQQLQSAWDGEAADGTDGIRHKLIEEAKAGNMLAIKLVAERVCSPLKPTDHLAEVDLQGNTLTEKAMGVLTALASGSMPLAQASQMLDGLATLAKIVETEELKQRLESIEKLLKEQGHGSL